MEHNTICESKLHEYRQQIDDIDCQLIEFLARRFDVARRIAKLKREHELAVVQPERAAEVEQRYVHRGQQHGVKDEFMTRLYHLIHQETCRIEDETIGR